jgi:hypothetical protein
LLTFGSDWNTLTVGDLFDRIRTTIPNRVTRLETITIEPAAQER